MPLSLIVALLTAPPAPASEPTPEAAPAPAEVTTVVGKRAPLSRVAGSAHTLSEKTLEAFEPDDVQRALTRVPGVYVRDEDGTGLRPNIGLRGVSSDRSAKVTLMEDGVLLAPAPYAAPAAYYFPLTTRVQRIEVYKGPAALRYGPHSIGGAINLVMRDVPASQAGGLDLAFGQHGYAKSHGHWGDRFFGGRFGVLAEGVYLRSDGFKDLDGGSETGFVKRETMARFQAELPDSGPLKQRLSLKLGYSDERSDETYLGLTDADFNDTPYRRYAASQEDRMKWWRTQVQASHRLEMGRSFHIQTTAYRHDLDRAWRKLNGFAGGPPLDALLREPDSGANGVFTAVLRGDEDSLGPEQTLQLGTNDRRFVSQGVQTVARATFRGELARQDLELGLRLHADEVRRHHFEAPHLMSQGNLVPVETPAVDTARNEGRTRALALHLADDIGLLGGKLRLAPGGRLELLQTDAEDRMAAPGEGKSSRDDVFVLPGLGAWYAFDERLGVLAGVHRGFSPVTPGQGEHVRPESAWNYEAGLRGRVEETRLELIGFFSDYDNLTAECTLSTGCAEAQLNEQFNGGQVHVWGLELTAGQGLSLGGGHRLALDLTYTLTRTELLNSFVSTNPQLGLVERGDELAYVPRHQGAATLGVEHTRWSASLAVTHVGEMRDSAGQGDIASNERIESHTVLDAAARLGLGEANDLYLRADNLLDSAYMASRRPFGLRPGKPREVVVGYKHRFGGP